MLSLERVVIATMETMATTSTMIAAEPNSGTTAPFTISIMTSNVSILWTRSLVVQGNGV